MQIDDFFTESSTHDPWATPTPALRTDLLTSLRAGPLPDANDLAVAIALTRLVHGELVAYGTNGHHRLTDDEIELAQRALRATLDRHGIALNLPWRDFSGFYTYWVERDARGSWQARRDILAAFFDPIFDELNLLEDAQFSAVIAEAVSPHPATGWQHVDEEIKQLKRRFRSAVTPQDYRDVGNRCVAVLEALSRTVYVAARHLRDGEAEPSADKTALRISRYVEDSLAGAINEEVRGVAKKVSDLAHKTKHRPTPTRRDAGIAADSAILLANILRRVDQEF